MTQDDYRQKVAEPRKASALDLFEDYWVRGMGSLEIAQKYGYAINENTDDRQRSTTAYDALKNHGIPTRDQRDSQQVLEGTTEVHELWPEYLTEFQISIAQFLNMLRIHELEEESR